LTYGERRKRADVQLILKDMDRLESAFLSKTQKLNDKRQEQLIKRVNKLLPELETAYEKGDKEEVKGILMSIQMPSQKEWRKHIHSLCLNSASAGVLRAHMELLRLKELYEFDEFDWQINVIDGGSDYEVVFPPEAQEWIRKYGYEIGVITEETVRERIRDAIQAGLEGGYRGRDLTQLVRETTDTWLSQSHAETIARTETAKMYNAGRIAKWLDPELNGFVEALQYDAVVDTRTTDLCRHLDGKIIAVSNARAVAQYTPPNHFRCRATWIAVTKYEEWTDDFPTDLKPDKGFQFEAPLPNLVRGKQEPLVRPKKKVDPSKVKDPDKIRSLNDEDFAKAIRNVKDQQLKLSLITERAEQMAVRDSGLVEEKIDRFNWDGIYKGDNFKSSFSIDGKDYHFYDPGDLDWAELHYGLMDARTVEEQDKLLAEFRKKNGKDFKYADLIVKLNEAFKAAPKSVKWKGLPEVQQSAQARKLLTIKTPPNTANYRAATGLKQAIKDGQSWISKHIISALAPETGVRLRFQHDLDRAYATGASGDIFFGRWEHDAGVVVHETAHVIHWNNKEVADLVYTFFEKRTKGEAMSLHLGENVKRDSFYNPYVGRVYGWEEGVRGRTTGDKFYGQEVLSMGMEAMYKNPEKFYMQDKEHFLLTYAIMRGLF
jgi:SPP1 gp7 family putative phage head morphogenesis protein